MSPKDFFNTYFQKYFDNGYKQIPANNPIVKQQLNEARTLFYPDIEDLPTKHLTVALKLNLTSIPMCIHCNTHIANVTSKGFGTHCSIQCRSQDTEGRAIATNKATQTLKEKYGGRGFAVPETKLKAQQRIEELYGTDNVFRGEQGIELRKAGMLKKYGVEHNSNLQSTIELRKQTNLKNIGVSCVFKTKEHRDNAKESYKESSFTKKLEYIENVLNYIVISKDPLVITCDKGHQFEYNYFTNYSKGVRCLECFPWQESKEQIEIKNFVESFGYNVIMNARKVLDNVCEIDVYIPELNLGIEYNGDYWHSSKHKLAESEFKFRHYNKVKICESKGITLLQFRDAHWFHKKDIVKSMITTRLQKGTKIYARKCIIKVISNKECTEFLNKTHIQGTTIAKIRLGLFYSGKLVQVMTFSKPRFNDKYDYELIRLASELNTTIVGGASKLFKYFLNNYKPNNIISYADMNYSKGDIYYNLGFEYLKTTTPGYIWIQPGGNSLNRVQTQKHKLALLLKDKFDNNKSETDNLYSAGYLKLFDSGQLVFSYSNNT